MSEVVVVEVVVVLKRAEVGVVVLKKAEEIPRVVEEEAVAVKVFEDPRVLAVVGISVLLGAAVVAVVVVTGQNREVGAVVAVLTEALVCHEKQTSVGAMEFAQEVYLSEDLFWVQQGQ